MFQIHDIVICTVYMGLNTMVVLKLLTNHSVGQIYFPVSQASREMAPPCV